MRWWGRWLRQSQDDAWDDKSSRPVNGLSHTACTPILSLASLAFQQWLRPKTEKPSSNPSAPTAKKCWNHDWYTPGPYIHPCRAIFPRSYFVSWQLYVILTQLYPLSTRWRRVVGRAEGHAGPHSQSHRPPIEQRRICLAINRPS